MIKKFFKLRSHCRRSSVFFCCPTLFKLCDRPLSTIFLHSKYHSLAIITFIAIMGIFKAIRKALLSCFISSSTTDDYPSHPMHMTHNQSSHRTLRGHPPQDHDSVSSCNWSPAPPALFYGPVGQEAPSFETWGRWTPSGHLDVREVSFGSDDTYGILDYYMD